MPPPPDCNLRVVVFTSGRFHSSRLATVLRTWGRSIPLLVVSDRLDDTARRLLAEHGRATLSVATGCPTDHRLGVCCKYWHTIRATHAARPRPAWTALVDDDAYVHTVRLEHNLRALLDGKTNVPVAPPGPYLYVGATLWASYIEQSFEVCGHGMGPNMAAGAAHTEKCAARGAVGSVRGPGPNVFTVVGLQKRLEDEIVRTAQRLDGFIIEVILFISP